MNGFSRSKISTPQGVPPVGGEAIFPGTSPIFKSSKNSSISIVLGKRNSIGVLDQSQLDTDSKNAAGDTAALNSTANVSRGKFVELSPWVQDYLLQQPPGKFDAFEQVLDDQLRAFSTLFNLETELVNLSTENNHLKPLSPATLQAASAHIFGPVVRSVYADHLKEFKARKPFAALLESFTEPTNEVSHPRGAGARINGVLEKHADKFYSVIDNFCPTQANSKDGQIEERLTDIGHEIYRQMRLYMNFLSKGRTEMNMEVENEVEYSAHEEPMVEIKSRKEDGELTEEEEGGGGGVSKAEVEKESVKALSVCNEVESEGDDVAQAQEESRSSSKKKKKKRKKSKSESHKKKKKRRDSSADDNLPRAYADRRQDDHEYREQPFFRPHYQNRPHFRPYNNRGYHQRGGMNFRGNYHNPNFRYHHRGGFRPFFRPYHNYNRGGGGVPASHRRRDQQFVSETSSDDGRRSRSRSRSRSRRSYTRSRSRSRSVSARRSRSPSPLRDHDVTEKADEVDEPKERVVQLVSDVITNIEDDWQVGVTSLFMYRCASVNDSFQL